MNEIAHFYRAIGIDPDNRGSLVAFSSSSGISVEQLRYYNERNVIPSGRDLQRICLVTGKNAMQLKLEMGLFDHGLRVLLQRHAEEIYKLVEDELPKESNVIQMPRLALETSLGRLYQGDCINVMKTVESDSVDLIFADPPFNLKKLYPSGIDDNLKEQQYIVWCEEWLAECVRILRPGGSIFLWNLPRWNTVFSGYLNNLLTFRHWIAVDIKYSMPISGRLYPSHYSLLYYCKGDKPNTFHPDRLQMEICPKCLADLKDYGGYKDKMNPDGINLTDVWYDIPPVRHSKYKKREGANELSSRLMDRIVEMSSETGDLIFDPFGGSGTTYAVAEIKKRRWLGVELGPPDDIIRRFEGLDQEERYLEEQRQRLNRLMSEDVLAARTKRGLWTPESVRDKKVEGGEEKQRKLF